MAREYDEEQDAHWAILAGVPSHDRTGRALHTCWTLSGLPAGWYTPVQRPVAANGLSTPEPLMLSPRLARLKEQTLARVNDAHVDRARLVTEAYGSSERKPICVRQPLRRLPSWWFLKKMP